MDKYLKEIFRKQCKMVDADFDKIDFHDEENPWFMKFTWTREKENEFKDWLVKRMEDQEFLRNISRFPSMNSKKDREKLANQIILQWGWKLRKNIGDKLYNQLSYKEKKFIAELSGSVDLGEVDIEELDKILEEL